MQVELKNPPTNEQFETSDSSRSIAETRFKADIAKLKEPGKYHDRFLTEEAQHLNQAIDILRRLQVEAFTDSSRVGFEKIRNAKFHLEQLLRDHFQS